MTLFSPSGRRAVAVAAVLATVALASVATPAAAVSVSFRTTATGLQAPVFVTNNGDSRLFIVEQRGVIKTRLADGSMRVFLDIQDRVLYDGGERGLFSVAFHPHYRMSPTTHFGAGRFYVNYTDNGGDLRLSEFRASNYTISSGVNPATERRLITIEHSANNNHNGGQVAFHPFDNKLYWSTGDGGGGGDPFEAGQNRNSLLGKIIRIDPYDPTPGSGLNYTSPTDNPFYGASVSGRDEVWSYGLRNPWRFSFDTLRGHLFIGDVGQSRWEEINRSRAGSTGRYAGRGANYGWDCFEGDAVFEAGCSRTGKTFPVALYATGSFGSRAVTGGYVERRSGSPLYGRYIFSDYYSGRIWDISADSTASRQTARLLVDTPYNVASFGRGYTGELYLVHRGGAVYRMVATP